MPAGRRPTVSAHPAFTAPCSQLTFGLVPPQFQYCFARHDPVKKYLQLSMDAKFNSSAMQAVVSAGSTARTPSEVSSAAQRTLSLATGLALQLRVKMKPTLIMPAFDIRLELSSARLSGRLNLGLQFTQEPPGNVSTKRPSELTGSRARRVRPV